MLVILASVALMNLETPPSLAGPRDKAQPAEIAAASPPAAAPITEAIPLSNPEPAPAAGLTPATAPDSPDLVLSVSPSGLIIPVSGISAERLIDTYSASRSEGRTHNAIDIMAPQGTPVVAATDGSVAKLHDSNKGGISLYQFDASGQFVYYYAHLMSYAAGITEGKQIKRGEVIGYVGDTGNATPGSYHLHFGISKTSSPGKWHGGTPINPFPLLRGQGPGAAGQGLSGR
jgi:murein DD-endopeptidase MepM/ murein hydrolase activator NlpD